MLYIYTSSNSAKFRKSAVERHLTTLKSLANSRPRPRFLAPHPEPAAVSLPGRSPTPLPLPLLLWPWLRPEIVQPEPSSGNCRSRSKSSARCGGGGDDEARFGCWKRGEWARVLSQFEACCVPLEGRIGEREESGGGSWRREGENCHCHHEWKGMDVGGREWIMGSG